MTVEAAVALGSLVLVLGVILAGMGALVVRVRCVDAAGEAARLASRDDTAGARAAALRLLPQGTDVVVEPRGEEVRVRVRAPPLGAALPALRVGAEAVAAREPGTAAPIAGADALPDGEPGDGVGPGDAVGPGDGVGPGDAAQPGSGARPAPSAVGSPP